MTKGEIITSIIERFDHPIRVLEIGRIRATDPAHEIGDGWSTLQFAKNGKVDVLYSIDNNPETLKACATFPEIRDNDKIVFLDSAEGLSGLEFDLIYLDAEENAQATVDHFRSVEGLMADGCLVLMDDVRDGSKGDLLMPLLRDEDWAIEEVGPMAVAWKGGV